MMSEMPLDCLDGYIHNIYNANIMYSVYMYVSVYIRRAYQVERCELFGPGIALTLVYMCSGTMIKSGRCWKACVHFGTL
jgi:hypothetical protein